MHALSESKPSHTLLFGLDANTYAQAKPGKQAAVLDFLADVKSKGWAATSGATPVLTTFNARTFLQPQLQKACKADEKAKKGDCNPKDFLLFNPAILAVADFGRDNTTKKVYEEEMVVPTLDWPSDHGLLYSTLLPVEARCLRCARVRRAEASPSREGSKWAKLDPSR